MAHWFVTGANGFIGQEVCRDLIDNGHRVTGLTRNVTPSHASNVTWVDSIEQMPTDINRILNLAGEGIADKRWSQARRQQLLDSRVALTEQLVKVANEREIEHVISASAVGFYGTGGEVDESAGQGVGFAADLCARWEAAAAGFAAPTAIIRLGVVLGGGGFLNRTLVPFSLGLGGPIGSGQQGFSWVHLSDVIGLIGFIADRQSEGVYNATGPQAITNRQMTQALAKAVKRPAVIPAPGFALRTLFGQMADELLLSGQMAVPKRALAEGYRFEFDSIAQALAAAVASKRSGSRGG